MTPLGLTFVGHATVLVEIGGARVLTDPVLLPRCTFLRRVVPPPSPRDYTDVDVVVVSHAHHDHLDLPSLRRVGRDVPVVVPPGAGGWLAARGFRQVAELPVGADLDVAGARIRAVPAVHDGFRVPRGPRAESIGFVLSSADEAVYFAGDTDLFPGMADLADRLSLALLPVWGWGPNLGPGHLDPMRAAEAAALVGAPTVVPIHWGTLYPVGLSRLRPHLLHRPPRDLVEAVQRLDLPTRVLITEPGSPVDLSPPWR
ncbi:MAG: MBL fold metallo-hydrolase [Actinomycetia bacterium]|jgi:L-ascorbate metabolism protein UlaG (beta-lactamase superfamily)|nr:MBL fold metallo-hydrolase [Actinomycetes bacterium]